MSPFQISVGGGGEEGLLTKINTDAEMILSRLSLPIPSLHRQSCTKRRTMYIWCVADGVHYIANRLRTLFFLFQFRGRCYGSNSKERSRRTSWRWCTSSRRDSIGRTSGPNSAPVRTSKDRSRHHGTTSLEIFRPSAHHHLVHEPTTTVSPV